MAAMQPNNEGLDPDDWVDPINPFGIDDGANFNVKIKKVSGFANFDDSSFGKVKPLAKTDAEIDEILGKSQSLTALVDPSKFKSYDDLKKRIAWVLGLEGNVPAQPQQARTSEASRIADSIGQQEATPVRASVKNDSGDSDIDYFKSLAADDDIPF